MSIYTTTQIAEGFYSLEQEKMVRAFLLIGDKQALLIDTCKDGDLKEIVDEITTLPVTVIFTHADGDHVGAAKFFERRFMHPSEFDHYKNKNEEVLPMEPIWEGDIVDIGTYRFEVILIPGHTPGSIALLEKEKSFLIGGDSIQTGGAIFMFGNGRNFEAFRASMKKLQGRINQFDVVYSSHNDLKVRPEIIHSLYTAAGKMLENKVAGEPSERFEGKVKIYQTEDVAFYSL